MAHLIDNIRKANLLKSRLIAVVTGGGRIVKASVSAGADLIIALNAGLYRNMGFGSLAAFMPCGNAHEQTEKLLKTHILANYASKHMVTGVYFRDPYISLRKRKERLKTLGERGE